MEALSINNHLTKGKSPFIEANTQVIQIEDLQSKCIIPVFAKDNEPTLSHQEFIGSVQDAVKDVFHGELITRPQIRVSHPISGRIPEAKDKPAKHLMEHEKTLFFERMMFLMEIPSLSRSVNGGTMNLSVGGVRSYHQDNLYSRRSAHKLTIFVGYVNCVCTNLMVSVDGMLDQLRASEASFVRSRSVNLLHDFDGDEQLNRYADWNLVHMSEQQFAEFVGRSRMYHHLPKREKAELPKMEFSDTLLNQVVSGFYKDIHFGRSEDGSISLWNLFNLLTGANRSSYVDKIVHRSINASEIVSNIEQYVKS